MIDWFEFIDIHCYWSYTDDCGTNWRVEEPYSFRQNLQVLPMIVESQNPVNWK